MSIDIKKAEKRLSEKRDEILELSSISSEARDTVELDQQSIGRLSRMDAMQQQEMAQAEARRRVHDLARIDIALNRIDEDEYGWCAECGEPIAYKRLEIDPAAALCIGCAK